MRGHVELANTGGQRQPCAMDRGGALAFRVEHLSIEDAVAMAISGQFYQSMHVSSLFLGLAGKVSVSSSGSTL
jgi:hypothetical protein